MRSIAFNWICSLALAAPLALLPALMTASAPALAAGDGPKGSATKLPIPRYVSLRSDRVNMRQGPSRDHGTVWVYRKANLPVEITAEFETWRKIRDADGSEGWVQHSMLSGRRTAVVSPWQKSGVIELRAKPDAAAAVSAHLEPRVIASIRKCDQTWCRVTGPEFDGYVQQKLLWGVYPDERVD